MNTNIANFSEYKKKFNTDVIYIGDLVEWQDYTGDSYQSVVTSITYMPIIEHEVEEAVKEFPLWEKANYSVSFSPGLTVIGTAVIRKIVKKDEKDKLKIFNPYSTRSFHV